jgi:hypothetical protein
MSNFKIFDGTNWIDPCDCAVSILDVGGSQFQQINPNACTVNYFDGTSWCPIICQPVGLQCGGELSASGFSGSYYVPFTIPAGIDGIRVTASPYGNPDGFSIVTSDKVTKLASIGLVGDPAPAVLGWNTGTSLTRTSYLYNGTTFVSTGSETISFYGEGVGNPPGGTPMSNTSGLSMYNPGKPLNPPGLPIPNLCSIDLNPIAEQFCYNMTYIKPNPAVAEDVLIQAVSGNLAGSGWKIFKLECIDYSVTPINDTTEINIWFDNSGSMDTTLESLELMQSTLLQACLLPVYNNDLTLYNERVKILNMNNGSVWNYNERFIKCLATERNFNRTVDASVNQVINLTFADESDVYGYGGGTAFDNSARSTQYDLDIANLRSVMTTVPYTIKGTAFRVNTGPNSFPGFRGLTQATFINTGVYVVPNNMNDYYSINFNTNLDTLAASTPTYYRNQIVAALAALNVVVPVCP